jgi:hypothetical protein
MDQRQGERKIYSAAETEAGETVQALPLSRAAAWPSITACAARY